MFLNSMFFAEGFFGAIFSGTFVSGAFVSRTFVSRTSASWEGKEGELAVLALPMQPDKSKKGRLRIRKKECFFFFGQWL